MIMSFSIIVLLAGIIGLGGWRIIKSRNMHIWIWSYILDIFKRKRGTFLGPTHIYFTLVDHFEPFHGGRQKDVAMGFVREWCERYPVIAQKFVDVEGKHPKHTIFYPEETYDAEVMDMIARVQREGYFDVEVHLHHDNDTSAELRKKLINYKERLYHRHGLLRKDMSNGQIIYGFIHGNWALDNSRPDGRMCGVNNELSILEETGCYADFTMPSAPSNTQTKKINSIYYAVDDPEKPKSHNTGRDLEMGGSSSGLLMIQGPLALNLKTRKYFLFPRIENGEIDYNNKITPDRIKMWIKNAPYVKRKPHIRFVKVYTHGCQDFEDREYLLKEGLMAVYSELCGRYNDSKRYILHFVSSYEMYLLVKSIESNSLSA